jgi:hypothetical protein
VLGCLFTELAILRWMRPAPTPTTEAAA